MDQASKSNLERHGFSERKVRYVLFGSQMFQLLVMVRKSQSVISYFQDFPAAYLHVFVGFFPQFILIHATKKKKILYESGNIISMKV